MIIEKILTVLTEDEKTILKDTIKHGFWGDTEEAFNDGEAQCNAYCTNDAKRGGHFSGRQASGLFRSLVSKLCKHGKGEYISHCSDWWGDNSGDMLFIRNDVAREFEEWARK